MIFLTIRNICEIINAKVVVGADMLDVEEISGFASDLMSDVLAFVQERTVLITGLVNVHVFRTAQMIDCNCIIFSRGKMPSADLIELGKNMNMVILCSEYSSYETSGLLYSHGLPSAKLNE